MTSLLLYHWENGAMGRYQFHTLRQSAIAVCTVGTMRKLAACWVIELRAFDMNVLTSDTFGFYKDYYCVDYPFTLEDLFYYLAMDGKGALLEVLQYREYQTPNHIAIVQAILFEMSSRPSERITQILEENGLYRAARQYGEES